MSLQGQWKKDAGLSWYFHTHRLKYSPVGAWLVHIWVSLDMVERSIALNHLAGFRVRKVEDFRLLAKGLNPLWPQKIPLWLSSSELRCACHSLMASSSTSDRAADLETNKGKRYRPLDELAAALAFLSVNVMWSRPP